MAEEEIKRVRFFDGQFLKEAEFQEEQRYHMHMRRRLNYMLFENSGVIPLTTTNDTQMIIEHVPGHAQGNKVLQVKPGMAIGKNDLELEGREIILHEAVEKNLADPQPPDAAIAAGGTAYITVHYAEDTSNVPPSEGSDDKDTRVIERATVQVHAAPPTELATADGDPYVLLGAINFDDMSLVEGVRQVAQFRASLGGAAPEPEPGGPTITGISPNHGAPGTTVQATITGTNLTGTTVDVSIDGPGVTITMKPGATATSIPVEIVIGSGLPNTTRTITVDVDGQTATVAFSVQAAAVTPVITDIDPSRGKQNEDLDIIGTNLAAATKVRFAISSDTSRFVDVSSIDEVGTGPGGQDRITVKIPPRSAYPPPQPSTSTDIDIIVFVGLSASAPAGDKFRYRN